MSKTKASTQSPKKVSKKSPSESRANFKRNLRRSIYVCGATLMLLSASVPSGVALADTINEPQTTRQARAGLADVSLLSNGQMTTNKANPQTKNAQGNYDLDLSYTGTGVANVGLATKKIMVFGLAPELRGKVVGGANIAVDAALTDINLSKIPGVSAEVALVQTALSLLGTGSPELLAVQNALNRLTSAQPLGTYHANVAGTVTNDRITADVTDGLGNYVKSQTGLIIADVQNALNALPASNPLTATLRGALQELLNVLNPIIGVSSNLLNNLLNVNLLGHTTARLTTTVSEPTAANTKVYGVLSSNGAVDIDLLSSEGDAVNLQFAVTPQNPLENYTVATPTLNPATAGDTSVSGNATLTEPIPDGTTFKAIATLPGGSTVTGDVVVDCNHASFNVDTGKLTAGQEISVKLQAVNGTNTKTGGAASVVVHDVDPTNPLQNYTVNVPNLDPATAGDTSISGNVDISEPIPPETTFKAIATLSDGVEKEANITINGTTGTFTIDTGALNANDVVSVKVQAKNAGFKKDGLPRSVTVQAEDPFKDYTVAAPSVDPANDGDAMIKGNANLNEPYPSGTTFTAIATLPGGIEKTAEVSPDGSYTINSGGLTEGEDISVRIQAKNGAATKDSTGTDITVGKAVVTNPIADYDVATPTLTTPKNGETSVSGTATLTEPIPAGTTFKAVATLPSGRPVTGEVTVIDGQATFTIDTGSLRTGQEISVKLQAVNGDNTKDGSPATTTVVANAFDDYTVNAPEVNPAKAGDTTITGNANLNTPYPDGTTFTAVATLPGGVQQTAEIKPDGTYTINSGALTAGEAISVKIQAKNGDATKDSTPTDMTVSEAENPLADYEVATPTFITPKNGDTSVSGSAVLTAPIPEGTTFKAILTLPDNTTKTVNANVDGVNATFTADTGTLMTGQVVSAKLQAVNGDNTKDGAEASTTVEATNPANPLDGYTVNAPTVNPAKAGEITVTGNANFNTPIPDGTTFEAIATLPGGSTKTATVNGDGSYSIDTGTLTAGQQINVKIQATNGDNTKDSLPTGIVVDQADPSNPLDGYTVNVPTVEPAVEGNTTIDGNANINTPFPEGTTFKAVATLPGNIEKEATVSSDGSFSIDSGTLIAREEISVRIVAMNGENTKDSLPVTFFVGKSDPTFEDPLTNYNVTTPTLNPAKNGDTSVSGSATLTTPIPDGTTFKAIATLPDGSTKTVDATVNGDKATFTVDTGALSTGQIVSVKLQAVNGDYTKDSSPASVTVEAGDPTNPTNPLDGYNVGAPTVNPAKGGDTNVTGNAHITTPVPDGTTFTAVATLPDGSTKTGTVNPDGSFNIDTGALTPGQTVNVKIVATNGDNTKDSAPVSITVSQPNVTNPLDDYNVGTPTVNPVNTGDTAVTGNANVTTPVPDGTTFTAVVTLPDGSTKTAPVNADGTFSIPIDGLTDGQTLSVKIVAANGDNTKDSTPVSVTVGSGQPSTPGNPGTGNSDGSGNAGAGNTGGSGNTGSGSAGNGAGQGSGGQTSTGNSGTGATGSNSTGPGTTSGTTGQTGRSGSSMTGQGGSGSGNTGSTGSGSTGSKTTGSGMTGTTGTSGAGSNGRSVTSGTVNGPRAIAPQSGSGTTSGRSGSQTTNQTQRDKSGVLPLTDQQRATVASILGAGLLIGAIAAAYRFIRKR